MNTKILYIHFCIHVIAYKKYVKYVISYKIRDFPGPSLMCAEGLVPLQQLTGQWRLETTGQKL